MGQITINNISGATPPYTVKVYQVGNNTPVFTNTTNNLNYTATFSHVDGQIYYAVVEKDNCSSYTSGNTTLNCSQENFYWSLKFCSDNNNAVYQLYDPNGNFSGGEIISGKDGNNIYYCYYVVPGSLGALVGPTYTYADIQEHITCQDCLTSITQPPTCNRTNNVFYNIKGKQGGISNPFSESEIYQYLCSGYNGAAGTTYAINNFNVGGIVYDLPCNFNNCSPSSHNGWYLAYLDSSNYCTSGSIAPPSCGIKGVKIINGIIQEIIDADTNPVCNLQFELLESAIGNCESTYTVTISKTSGNTPFFIRYGWSITNDVSTVNNWQLSNTFVVNSNNINRYFFVEYTINACTPIPKLAGFSQRNCNTCSLTTGLITYSCNNNSSSTYTVNFLISGGTGNYKYSTDNGTTWNNTAGNVTTNAIKGQTIIIANSDSTCQTSVYLDNNTNPCELCFDLSYSNIVVSCASGSTERKRVTFNLSTNISSSGCPLGNFEYSDDNGVTWTTTSAQFNKIYDGFGANVIKVRYSLYTNKILTIDVPLFKTYCLSYAYFDTETCSCVKKPGEDNACGCTRGTINTNGQYRYTDCTKINVNEIGVLYGGGAELGTEICYIPDEYLPIDYTTPYFTLGITQGVNDCNCDINTLEPTPPTTPPNNTSCSSCVSYSITDPDTPSWSISYKDCNGNLTTKSGTIGEVVNFCGCSDGMTITSGQPNISILGEC